VGYQPTHENLRAIVGWTMKEGSLVKGAKNNPLNDTLPADGATPFNTIKTKGGGVIHVWNYPSCEVGMSKTVTTLKSQAYADIRSELAKGTGNIGQAASLHVWGTGSIPSSIMAQADAEVAASGK